MTTPKKTLFISDLHLDDQYPVQTALFLDLLKQCDPTKVDALYILGDLFEIWIGDDNLTPYNQRIIHALYDATSKGLTIYIMVGNRDFLLGQSFLKQTGCHLLEEQTVIALYGSRVLLMHGDTLCTKDLTYLKWRNIAHNRLFQTLFLTLLPLAIRNKIAAKARHKSMQHTQHASLDIMDVTQHEVEKIMQHHAVRFLIHGHTHRPNIHTFSMQQQIATRIVLGAWHDGASVLTWDDAGNKKLETGMSQFTHL